HGIFSRACWTFKPDHASCWRKSTKTTQRFNEIDKSEKKRSLGRDYHPLCLKCHKCKRQLTAGQHAEHDEKPYCTNCYMRDFGPRGSRNPVARTFNTAAS
uniref:Cysteine-rich protein 1 n=1 Tax=Sinocyclocheilus anshuiensis TaxID=1608454 RepID=A0A671RBN5_9TELE